jgi:hypothetical protein
MERKGLFNKVKNKATRRKFVVSTIRKGDDVFETGVFVANFFYIPRHLSQPDLALVTHSRDEALTLHYKLTARFTEEHPMRVMQDYFETASSAPQKD